jgi:hypothetical protein
MKPTTPSANGEDIMRGSTFGLSVLILGFYLGAAEQDGKKPGPAGPYSFVNPLTNTRCASCARVTAACASAT